MPKIYLWQIMKSNFCKIVFVLLLAVSYLLIPEAVFHESYRLLALVYMLTFASLGTCVVRNVVDKIRFAHQTKASFLGLLAAIIGMSAFQVCSAAAPVCGISAGLGIVSMIFPGFFLGWLDQYSVIIIYISIIMQLIALMWLKCLQMQRIKKS